MPLRLTARHWLATFGFIGVAVLGVMLLPAQEATPPADPTATPEPLACELTLEGLWALVSDACAAGPVGYICNGGSAPQARPDGAIASALAPVGALVETGVVEAVQTLPIITEVVGGGVMWFRWADPHYTTGLIIGEALLVDLTPRDQFAAWTNFVVQTGLERPDCPTTPQNMFVLETQANIRARQVINGVSIDLTGAVAVRTLGDTTVFMALSGRNALTVLGVDQPLWTGQQVIVSYAPGDFTRPIGIAQPTSVLDPTLIENFPSGLLDRPVWAPQPGYATTEGAVNLRYAPQINAPIVGQVPAGELLTILGRNEAADWLHVSLDSGISGWMFAELLNVNAPPVSLAYEATPQPPQRFGTLQSVARVRAPAGLNVRANPGVDFAAVGLLPNGAQVILLQRSPYNAWVKVADEYGTELGWVALVALDTRSNVNALPVAVNVPPPPAPPEPTPIPGVFGNAFPDPNLPGY
ncbi:MAG: SH3 domain-containing protein [Phototrophicaceae bacterium]